MALGSEGRREQTLRTDQDNAIVFADVPPDREEEVQKYFLKLAEKVVAGDKEGLSDLLAILLSRRPAAGIINQLLVPAMRRVGDLFGRGEMGSNLRNLVPENQTGSTSEDEDADRYSIAGRLLGIGTGEGQDRRNLLVRLDKRSEKGDAVMAYVQELWASRGQLG
jgi:hypothetical protein